MTLRPGYNVVAAEGAVLRRLLEALLHPDPADGDALPRAAGAPANAPVKAGLTLVGNDRVTYRLVRDFSTGAQLHRFDAATRAFALVSRDLAEIGALMQGPIGAPAPGRLSALLSVSAAELPSRQGAVAAGAAGGVPTARPAPSPEQVKQRLAALRAELEKARLGERLQERLDGLQSRLFKLEEALRGGAKLREGLEAAQAARAEVEGAARVAAQLGDPGAKLAAFERASARREEAAARVAAEREALAAVEERGAPRPFWSNPLFWAGAGGGLALAIGSAAGAAAIPDLRYLAVLDVPAFGFGAWVALRWVASAEQWEKSARRRRIVDEWEKKMEAQFERDAGEIRDAMKALSLSKPSELAEALARVAEAEVAVAEWRSRLAEWEASPEARDAVAEKAKVEEALSEVEGRLSAEVGGFVRDVRSVEDDLRRLERGPAPGPAADPLAARPAAPAGDPLRTLLERAAAELGASPAATARSLSRKASLALSGLSFQRLQALQADDRGNLQAQAGGRPVPVATLAPADRDLVFLALKLALVEQALAAEPVVAVADEAFAGLSEGARRFAARLLKQIARPGQLVHATADPSFREAADHAA